MLGIELFRVARTQEGGTRIVLNMNTIVATAALLGQTDIWSAIEER
jgi:hypothetical protein